MPIQEGMTTITNTLIDGIGNPVPNIYTEIRLLAPSDGDNAFQAETEAQIVSRVITRTNTDGVWSLDLIPTGDITPENSVYQVTHKIPGQPDQVSYFQVPAEGATPTPVQLEDCLTIAPTGQTGPTASGSITMTGVPIVRKFAFAFDTPNILTGADMYTPTVGDVLLDAWIEIDTAWDGTAPYGDVGTFGSTNVGLFNAAAGAVIDMTAADYPSGSGWGDGVLVGGQESRLSLANAIGDTIDIMRSPSFFVHSGDPNGLVTSRQSGDICFDFTTPGIWAAVNRADTVWDALAPDSAHVNALKPNTYPTFFLPDGVRTVPLKFTAANPVKVCVTQNGRNNGADPGSTQGAAVLYLVTATPR